MYLDARWLSLLGAAPRTLHSLSAGYQRHIDTDDYEVIVVDNDSNPPFDPKVIEGLSGPPNGLTVVTEPDPTSQVLSDQLADAVARFIDVLFSGIVNRLDGALNIVSNDWCTADGDTGNPGRSEIRWRGLLGMIAPTSMGVLRRCVQ